MPLLEEGLFGRLSGFAGLSALVSTRIYPDTIPQNATFPLVEYHLVSGLPTYVMGGESGVAEARLEVNSYATSASGVRALAEQVRLALSGYRGTIAGVQIDLSLADNRQDLYEPETRRHRIAMDFLVHYRQAIPA